MFRKDLVPLLLNNAMTVTQIAQRVGETPGQIASDLHHLFRSLKHTEYGAVVEPSCCRDCGFEFSGEKLKKPSKCPKCRGTWLSEPRIRVEQKRG